MSHSDICKKSLHWASCCVSAAQKSKLVYNTTGYLLETMGSAMNQDANQRHDSGSNAITAIYLTIPIRATTAESLTGNHILHLNLIVVAVEFRFIIHTRIWSSCTCLGHGAHSLVIRFQFPMIGKGATLV